MTLLQNELLFSLSLYYCSNMSLLLYALTHQKTIIQTHVLFQLMQNLMDYLQIYQMFLNMVRHS